MDYRFIVYPSLTMMIVSVIILPINLNADRTDMIFTSTHKIRMLLETEKEAALTVDQYLANERNRLLEIEKYLQTWKGEREVLATDDSEYFENPFKKYRLIKRLTTDWYRVCEKMKQNNADDLLANLYSRREFLWPTMNDLEAVQDCILINRIKADDLSTNKIAPLSTNIHLTGYGSLNSMKQYEKNYSYNVSRDWTTASIRESIFSPDDDNELLNEIIRANLMANLKTGSLTNAEHDYILFLSTVKPNSAAVENLGNLLLKMSQTSSTAKKRESIVNITRLCLNSKLMISRNDLRCKYNFNNSPFLRIAPLKEEIVSSDPRIVIFRNVLYENEIQKLIEEGKRRMFDKVPTGEKSDEIGVKNYQRMLEFFAEEDLEEINIITQRTHDMTGLNKNSVQPWQINFYDVGGYFPEHSDLDHAAEEEVEKQGRRLATVSYSLGNVDIGGATIFPRISIKIDPNRGDAVMWFNVQEDGSEDIRIRHAVCPIMMGHKWERIQRVPMRNDVTSSCWSSGNFFIATLIEEKLKEQRTRSSNICVEKGRYFKKLQRHQGTGELSFRSLYEEETWKNVEIGIVKF